MAITQTTKLDTVWGNYAVRGGTYVVSGGATGGNIDTGLDKVVLMFLTAMGGSVVASAPTVDEDLQTSTHDGSAITIIVTQDTAGEWLAIGYWQFHRQPKLTPYGVIVR
jgi:hypothetical protein